MERREPKPEPVPEKKVEEPNPTLETRIRLEPGELEAKHKKNKEHKHKKEKKEKKDKKEKKEKKERKDKPDGKDEKKHRDKVDFNVIYKK